MTTPFAPLLSSAALPSSLSVTGHRSIWKRAASSRASSAFAVTCGVPVSDCFGPQGARKPRRDRTTQPSSTAVARVPYRVQLHPGISRRQRQRECRLFSRLPLPATEFDRSGPSSLTPSDDNASSSSTRTAYLLADPLPCASVGVGWRPLTRALAWVGSRSPLTIFKIFANTGPE